MDFQNLSQKMEQRANVNKILIFFSYFKLFSNFEIIDISTTKYLLIVKKY